MSNNQILHPNLITVIPGNITIQNFIPGKLYKDNISIYNTCNVPIVFTLRSSDRNKLFVGESTIRLGVNQAKKIPLVIQDKIKYNYNKLPTQKVLYIHLSGELIDEKFEIVLNYFNKGNNNKKDFSDNSIPLNYEEEKLKGQMFQPMNYNFTSNYNTNDIENTEENFEQFEQMNSNINNIFKNNNNNILSNNNNNNNNNNSNNSKSNVNKSKINNSNQKEVLDNFVLKRQNYNLNKEEELKRFIDELIKKISEMKSILDTYQFNFNNKTRFDDSNLIRQSTSLYFISDKCFIENFKEKEKEIIKQEQDLEISNIKNQNKILMSENQVLEERIKILENQLNDFKSELQYQKVSNDNIITESNNINENNNSNLYYQNKNEEN
jgi:polyhydroxyalkanoate synthesis regulator phasin